MGKTDTDIRRDVVKENGWFIWECDHCPKVVQTPDKGGTISGAISHYRSHDFKTVSEKLEEMGKRAARKERQEDRQYLYASLRDEVEERDGEFFWECSDCPEEFTGESEFAAAGGAYSHVTLKHNNR